jgi:hypothetical protein
MPNYEFLSVRSKNYGGQGCAHTDFLALDLGPLPNGSIRSMNSGVNSCFAGVAGRREVLIECGEGGFTGDITGDVATHAVRDGKAPGFGMHDEGIFVAAAYFADVARSNCVNSHARSVSV